MPNVMAVQSLCYDARHNYNTYFLAIPFYYKNTFTPASINVALISPCVCQPINIQED